MIRDTTALELAIWVSIMAAMAAGALLAWLAWTWTRIWLDKREQNSRRIANSALDANYRMGQFTVARGQRDAK